MNASRFATRAGSVMGSPAGLAGLPVALQGRQHVEVGVACGDLEAHAGGLVGFEDEPAVAKDAMNEIRRSVVQDHHFHDSPEPLLEPALQPETLAESVRGFRQEDSDIEVAVLARGAAGGAAEP